MIGNQGLLTVKALSDEDAQNLLLQEGFGSAYATPLVSGLRRRSRELQAVPFPKNPEVPLHILVSPGLSIAALTGMPHCPANWLEKEPVFEDSPSTKRRLISGLIRPVPQMSHRHWDDQLVMLAEEKQRLNLPEKFAVSPGTAAELALWALMRRQLDGFEYDDPFDGLVARCETVRESADWRICFHWNDDQDCLVFSGWRPGRQYRQDNMTVCMLGVTELSS